MPGLLPTSFWSDVDRIALCIHRPSGANREFRALVERLQIPAGSFVVLAARHIAGGRVTLDQLQLLARYESRALIALNARRHVELGFFDELDGRTYSPTAEFRTASRTVLELQARSAEDLWAGTGDLTELAALAGSVVARSTPPVPVPALSAQRADHHTTPASPAGQLLAFVTELRYLRSDLHAHALAACGLYGPTARAVHHMWMGRQVSDEDLHRLREKALVVESSSGWELSEAARSARAHAQVETERLSAIALEATHRDELERLLEGLAGLPGDDPRPPSDR